MKFRILGIWKSIRISLAKGLRDRFLFVGINQMPGNGLDLPGRISGKSVVFP
jgi:hypothetical protein